MEKYIGCSGFHYDGWKKEFYPEDLPKEKWLEYYAGHFNTVEINSSFYSMPAKEDMKMWKDQVPDDFRFTIKANRFLTHLKKLKMDKEFLESLSRFQETVQVLDGQLGCLLWQLPANLHKDLSKLDSFSETLDMSMKHVFEFRHASWFDKEVFDLLEENELGYCILSAPEGLPDDVMATARTAYVRFHGRNTWYDYHYSDEELKSWKERLDKLDDDVKELYIYFNNDPHAWSVENARKLRSMMNA